MACVSERSHQDAEEEGVEETVAQPQVSPDAVVRTSNDLVVRTSNDVVVSSVERATPGGEEERERPSPLDMLFREAEVIARNLKESGTRR
jgi:hypothetical protein